MPKVRPKVVRLYTIAEVAKAIGASRQTVYNWLDADALPYSYEVGGAPVFTEDELEAIRRFSQERRAALNTLRLPNRSTRR